MFIAKNLLRAASRGVVIAAFASAATLGLNAQQNAQQNESSEGTHSIFFVQPVSTASLIAANDAPATLGYSSSAGAAETDAAVNFMAPTGASPAMQPPPRRYGRRPIYADSAHNADGSNKYTFFGGAGFTLPTGGTHAYLSPSYNFQVGAGRNFNKKLAAVIQFDWANFGFSDNAKNYLLNEYGPLCNADDGCTGSAVTEVGGNSHDWSFTVGPMYTFAQNDKEGAYVVGGVGFYHKIANITTPGIGTYCDPYYGCEEYEANETIDKYTSNSVGFNGGLGFTYKPSRFGNEKFFAEARYVYTDNQPKPFYDGVNPPTTNPTSNANYFNAFPQNSAKTTYIPITFGVRF